MHSRARSKSPGPWDGMSWRRCPPKAGSKRPIRRCCSASRTTSSSASRPRRKERVSTPVRNRRSEEHTSELQSHVNLVCRLLLEKKKKKQIKQQTLKKENG